MDEQREEHLTTTEARAGQTPHMTRYILGISMVLIVALFVVIVFVAAA